MVLRIVVVLVGFSFILIDSTSDHLISNRHSILPTFQYFHFLHLIYSLVNSSKLPSPPGVVQEWSVVKPVVIRAVHLRVVAWSEGSHLVSVDGVVSEEQLDLSGHLVWGEVPLLAPSVNKVGEH